MTTFKSSLHKRQTTKTKEGHRVALVHGTWGDNGLWWEDGRASKISDDIVELYDYKNHQGTAQFKWAARFRNEAASFKRERANQVWRGHACNPTIWWGRGAGAGGSPPVQGQPGLLSVRPALTTDSFSAQGTKEGGSEGRRDRQADRNIPSGWIIRNKYKYACMGVI